MSRYHGTFAEYSKIVHEMDSKYGGPNHNNKKQVKGRKALFQIFRYLSTHRGSTCEEIALYEIRHNPKSKRKLKSVTDDIRKFILSNLLPKKLVKEEGTKKKYNKKIQSYSLDHNGVLYAIHLLSKNKPHQTFATLIIYDEDIIQNLAVEYSEYLPFIFDRLNILKSFLGKYWLDYLQIHEIATKGLDITGGLLYGPPDVNDILNDFVVRSWVIFSESKSPDENLNTLRLLTADKKSWINLQHHLTIKDPWGIGVSLLIYNNVLGELWRMCQRANLAVDKDAESIRVEAMNQCMKMFSGEPELWNWYRTFVNAAILDVKENLKKLTNFEDLVILSK